MSASTANIAITGALLAAGCNPDYLDETRAYLGFQEVGVTCSTIYEQMREAIEAVEKRHS